MEGQASAFLQKALATILDIPHMFRSILTRQRNTERDCIEEGLLRNSEHSSRHLEELELGERPRKRTRLVYDEGEGEYHNEGLQTSAYVSPGYADTSRIVRDGSFDQLAISLSTDLISQIHDAGKAARALEQQDWLLQDAERALNLTEARVSSFQIALQSTQDDEEYARIQEESEILSKAAQKACERRDTIKTDFEVISRNEGLYKNQLQHLLERTLEEAGLLDVPSLEPHPLQYSNQRDEEQDDSTSLLSDDTALSSTEILRRTAYEDLYSAQEAMEQAEIDFENREDIYLNQLDKYEQAFQAGQIDMSRSDFDCHMFNHTRALTRAFIDAETQVKEATARAIALGLDTLDEFDLGPENRNHKDDGYGVSGEAVIVQSLDRDRIYRWWDGVAAACPESFGEIVSWDEPDVDKWGAKSVGMSDTNSAIDVDEYVDKIKSWKEHCGQLREERLGQRQDGGGGI